MICHTLAITISFLVILEASSEILHQTSRQLLSSSWQSVSDPPLPRADDRMAIGYYNHTIFMCGGRNNQKQLTEYNTLSNNMIDYGKNVFNVNVRGRSEYYTQIENILYWIDGDSGASIRVYNLQTKDFIANMINIPASVSDDGCLASTNDFLFVIGGTSDQDNTLSSLQILNISTGQWTVGPNMSEGRIKHACIVDPTRKQLWVMGGQSTQNGFADKFVQKISIDDLTNTQWGSNTTQLLLYVDYPRTVLHEDFIYVIGGMYYCNHEYPCTYVAVTDVQIINCDDGSVTKGKDLSQAIWSTVAIKANNKIYAFGGAHTSSANNVIVTSTWQFIDLPTIAPTNNPSNNPTHNPTNGPTTSTTTVTMNPSHSPSIITTIITQKPTTSPEETSTIPTLTPTKSPQKSGENYSTTAIIFPTGSAKLQHRSGEAIVIILILSFICCTFIIIYYIKCQQKRNNKLMKNYNKQRDDCYIELVEHDNYSTEGQGDYSVIATATPSETTRTYGESVSLQSASIMESNDRNNQEDEDDDIYQYAPPTQGMLKQNEGDIGNNQIENMENDNYGLPQETNTAGSFGQILNDNVMSVDLIMDDIIADMDTEK